VTNGLETTRSCQEWIRDLAARSQLIAGLELEASLDPTALLTRDALSLASCPAHCRLIVRAIERLLSAPGPASLEYSREVLRRLIQHDTYGAFAELAGYEWLGRCGVEFEPQVQLAPSDVLGVAGSMLDGKIRGGPYFDIKGFGFSGRLARRLQEKLQANFPNEQVLVSGSWDIALAAFEELIRSTSRIAGELRTERYIKHGRLEIRLEKRQPITVSSRVADPYRLARENARFAFADAQQFTKNESFVSLYVIHPWFNAATIGNDFGGMDATLTRSLARRTFMQFSNDPTPLADICDRVAASATMGDASRLLSAIFFVNVWPTDADTRVTQEFPSWLYLNPRATHPVTRNAVWLLGPEAQGVRFDAFADDDY
jgi:hypothetical protein